MTNEKRLIDANAKMIDKHFNRRLIDYHDFVKECNHFYENPPFPHPATPWHKGLQLAVEIAMRLPAVDAVEVVHGRWLFGYPISCSVCGGCAATEYEDGNIYQAWYSPYCPSCGAKMDGGNEDD